MGKDDKPSKHRKRSRSSSPDKESRKKKKAHKRRRSSSSSSSDEELKFELHLNKEREEKKRLKKVDKERRKEMETPEEKRARRLAKKMAKEDKRKQANDGYLPPQIAYTNDNNPFNDTKLTDTFIWGKKLQKDGNQKMSKNEIEADARKRVEKNFREVEELKRARDARRAAREDMDMIQRDLDRKSHGEWTVKESEFQLQQAKVRSKLRIDQNRAKPIDLLSRYIQFGDDKIDDCDFDLDDPLSFIKDLTQEDYDDLMEDIKVYRRLEGDRHIEFWDDIRTVVDSETKKLQSENSRKAIHGSVHKDVSKIMKDKSLSELVKLEADIRKKIDSGSSTMDISYWEDIFDHVTVHIAKTRLKELHQKMLKMKLKKIREEQMKEMADSNNLDKKPIKPSTSRPPIKTEEGEENVDEELKQARKKVDLDELDSTDLNEAQRETKWRALTPERLEMATVELYERGSYSPTYGDINDTMPGIEILDEDDDAKTLLEKRQKNKKAPQGISDIDAAMLAIARKGMDGSEATFSVETPIASQDYLWSDKYRPRKPTYLNRVMTGFDWNKYNQTHYDMDNPPPKIVQGYKFNIFYPDLLDKRKTPSYQVFECDDPDFAEVRFQAGPPYEDIAFKIVNREWEVNYKNGFKCQFHNGVFQLWFTFKKYRYRR